MSQTDGGKLPDTVSLKKRLLWWFGIYLGAQLPLILLFPFILDYPWGLGPYFAFVCGSSNEPAYRMTGFLVYIVHFLANLTFSSRTIFNVLRIILIVIVILNTGSCMKMAGPTWYKGLPNIQG
jgi:hypothetical protein